MEPRTPAPRPRGDAVEKLASRADIAQALDTVPREAATLTEPVVRLVQPPAPAPSTLPGRPAMLIGVMVAVVRPSTAAGQTVLTPEAVALIATPSGEASPVATALRQEGERPPYP